MNGGGSTKSIQQKWCQWKLSRGVFFWPSIPTTVLKPFPSILGVNTPPPGNSLWPGDSWPFWWLSLSDLQIGDKKVTAWITWQNVWSLIHQPESKKKWSSLQKRDPFLQKQGSRLRKSYEIHDCMVVSFFNFGRQLMIVKKVLNKKVL